MLKTPLLTINDSGMPSRVIDLCNGLHKISLNFCIPHLNEIFTEFESHLTKDSMLFGTIEYSAQKALFKVLESERKNIIDCFLRVLEDQLATIRTTLTISASAINLNIENLSLVEISNFDQKQLLPSISARYESLNNMEIHRFRQRISVISGMAPFENDSLPLSPNSICVCLRYSLQGLDLSTSNFELLCTLIEKHIFNNYSVLLEQCNYYLAEQRILSNLGHLAYRSPESRHKKTPKSLNEGSQKSKSHSNVSTAQSESSYNKIDNKQAQITAENISDQGNYSFQNFRELLAQKKKSFNNSVEVASSSTTGNIVPASREVVIAALNGMKISQPNTIASASSIQAIKQHLQSQLLEQSSKTDILALAPEDDDAIDIIAMLMESATEKLSPGSATSQIMAMLQAPLLKVALQDKSFFENKDHPARKLFDLIAKTSMTWLDVVNRDEKLYSSIVNIVSDISDNSDNGSQALQTGYEETNRLLQTLIKKAESIERRQIDIAKGKERLDLARTRAEETIDNLISGRVLTPYTKSMLLNSWADVLMLTELRHGNESSTWRSMEETTECIIAAGVVSTEGIHHKPALELTARIQESLQMVGYHTDEAAAVSEKLFLATDNNISSLPAINSKIKSNALVRPSRTKLTFNLNNQQIALVNQITALPFGTWFEFQSADMDNAERRKMAWASHTTHHVLFVNSRGQRISEMLIEELAIAMSAGIARIPETDNRGFIERALDSAFSSIKNIIPSKSGAPG